MATITMKQMLEAGIHFGHQTRRWNPKMGRYIYGERHGIYIIDLQKTLQQLQKAYGVVRKHAAAGGTVMFVGTKKQARDGIRREAERCGMYYVNNRWLGGMLTNWQTIQKSVQSLRRLEEMDESGKLEQFTKKEAIQLRKQRDKLDKNLCGIKNMESPPAVMFVIDSNREAIAVREAERCGIECVAIVDTNSDPDAVPIPIPGNDDAIRSINLFCEIIADAVIEGRGLHEKRMEEEKEGAIGSGDLQRSAALTKQHDRYEDTLEGKPEDKPEDTLEAAEAAEAAGEAVSETDSESNSEETPEAAAAPTEESSS